MIVEMHSLKEGVVKNVDHSYDPIELDLELNDVHFAEPVEMQGQVERVDNTLMVKGHLAGKIKLQCGRCLEDVPKDLNEDFDFYEEIDDRDEIDITNEIRDVIMLSYPIPFLCETNEKGDCIDSGKEHVEVVKLKTEEVEIEEKEKTHRPFANLKRLIEKKK